METGTSPPKTAFANAATVKIASKSAFDICKQGKNGKERIVNGVKRFAQNNIFRKQGWVFSENKDESVRECSGTSSVKNENQEKI